MATRTQLGEVIDSRCVDREIADSVLRTISLPGTGDMTKAVYDTNNNGVVDDAERLSGMLPEELPVSDAVQQELDNKADSNHTHAELHTHPNKALLDTLTNSGAGDKFLADDGDYKTVSGNGGGDMLKSVYDTDDNGIVDNAEMLGGIPAADYALKTDIPTVPADTDDLPEGTTNLYYTDARVEANTEVSANTAARHTHSNQAVLDAITDAGSGSVITQAERDKLSDAVVSDLGSDPGEIVGNMVAMLQADYDVITPDPNTLYIILPAAIKEPDDGPVVDDPVGPEEPEVEPK